MFYSGLVSMKNTHASLLFQQHLRTIRNTHNTMSGFNGSASSQHQGDVSAQEEVSLSPNKTNQACAWLKAERTYASHFKYVRCLQSGGKALEHRVSQGRLSHEMASGVCRISQVVLACIESMFVYVSAA